MSPLLILSTIAISAALVFYTWGVFGERRSGTLTRKYVTLFWIGLACDTTGTLMMSSMAAQTAGGMGVHGITGIVAIVLMLIHATWATWTYLRGSEQAQKRFHTFSTVVWLAWLIPYIIGILMGIPAIHLKAVCAAGTSVIVVAILSVLLALPATVAISRALSANPNVLLLPQERGVQLPFALLIHCSLLFKSSYSSKSYSSTNFSSKSDPMSCAPVSQGVASQNTWVRG